MGDRDVVKCINEFTHMEAFIHNKKLWTEGLLSPAGSVYSAIESLRG
jgi:NADH:ubiquinone oxidoreductase subunit D